MDPSLLSPYGGVYSIHPIGQWLGLPICLLRNWQHSVAEYSVVTYRQLSVAASRTAKKHPTTPWAGQRRWELKLLDARSIYPLPYSTMRSITTQTWGGWFTTIQGLYYYTRALLQYNGFITIRWLYYYTRALLLYKGFTTIQGLYYYTRALLLYEGFATIQGLYYYTRALLPYEGLITIHGLYYYTRPKISKKSISQKSWGCRSL